MLLGIRSLSVGLLIFLPSGPPLAKLWEKPLSRKRTSFGISLTLEMLTCPSQMSTVVIPYFA